MSVESTGALNFTMTIASATVPLGLPGVLCWQGELQPPPLILMDTVMGVAGLLLCHSNNLHLKWGSKIACLLSLHHIMWMIPWIIFRGVLLFWSWASLHYPVLVSCLLPTFRFWCGHSWHCCSLNCLYFDCCNPLSYSHGRHTCLLVLVLSPCQEWVAASPLLWVEGCYMVLKLQFPSHPCTTAGYILYCGLIGKRGWKCAQNNRAYWARSDIWACA